MERYNATLWRNMNIALPYEIVERLGLKPGDKIFFNIVNDHVVVEKGA